MITESEIRNMLEKEIQDCIKVGKAHAKIGYEECLSDYCGWYVVMALCDVLEENSCEVWNRIVTECPNMGEITEC